MFCESTHLMKIFLWALYCITTYIYASQSKLEIEAIPHVVSFSFPKEQLAEVHSILEEIYKRTDELESIIAGRSVTPTASEFHFCPSTKGLEGRFKTYFMSIAEIFVEQMNKFVKPNHGEPPSLSFRAAVPGAYCSAAEFLQVCKKPLLIHRDSQYIDYSPSDKSENEFTLIVSENFAVEKSEGKQKKQVLVGTSVYNQHGEKPRHIIAKQSGEITITMISQSCMHSTSHECIPEDFESNINDYCVKRSLFQGYFTGPDTDQIDWDQISKIIGDDNYNAASYERIKTQINASRAKAYKEYQDKVDAHYNREGAESSCKKKSYWAVSRAIEMQFREFQDHEILPTLEEYNIYQYLIARREMSKFTDAFVAAVSTSIPNIGSMIQLLLVKKTLQNELENEHSAFLQKIQDIILGPQKLDAMVLPLIEKLCDEQEQERALLIQDFRRHLDYLLKRKKQLEEALRKIPYNSSKLQDSFDLE